MECFIKKIFDRQIDESTHNQFIRFGKGVYESRAVLNFWKTKKIKINGTFEYANDFALLVAELENINFSGIVLSKQEIPNLQGKKKASIYEYEFKGNSSDILELSEKAYAILVDAEDEEKGIKLKIKKKLPKPGKSGDKKVDDKFCILEADLRHMDKIKQFFLWDLPDCKKAKISHTYEIKKIIFPQTEEKNYEKIRLLAKRKGKLIRRIIIDKNETRKECEFEV